MGNHGHLKYVIGKTHSCQRTAVHQTDNFNSINYNIVGTLIVFKMWLINLWSQLPQIIIFYLLQSLVIVSAVWINILSNIAGEIVNKKIPF